MRIETPSGWLRGSRRGGVLAFRGIPYAEAPLGKLRWQAPRKAGPWPGVRDARRPGPGAPQLVSRLGRAFSRIAGPTRTSEDCLTVDVVTPAIDGRRRPVLVWIHGGAFLLGAGSALVYAGERLARSGDVVVVTFNYRLGALGFLALGDVAPRAGIAENCGLQDQIAALEWVRDHIAAFGGDPGNVTLLGQSAGAMSVGSLLAAPRARGLFARAIAQSGAASNWSSRAEAARVARLFLELLGIAPTDAARLRELPVEALLAAQLEMRRLALPVLPWQPVVDGDLLPRPPLESIRTGSAAGVPLLVGTTRDEWNLFQLGDARASELDEAGLLARFRSSLDPDCAASLHRLYRDALPAASPGERWATYQTHRIFLAPARALTSAQTPHAPTWTYLFSWSPPLVRGLLGACHALEVPLLFGTFRHPFLRALYLGGARAAARELQEAWLRFARTGHAPAASWSPAPAAPFRLCADDRGAWSAFEHVSAAYLP